MGGCGVTARSPGTATAGSEPLRGDDDAGAGVTPGSPFVIGTATVPVGPTGSTDTSGTPGSVASIPVDPGAVTLMSIGAPPVPPDTEPPTGSWMGGSGAGRLGGIVTLSAEAGAAGVASAARPANAASTASRPCLMGTTSRV